MNIEELYELQKELDTVIVNNYCKRNDLPIGLANQSDFLTERLLALSVEVGELANKTRSFKYWSIKSSEPREEVMEELVDVLFFWLSVANSLGYEANELEQMYLEKYQINLDRQKNGY